MAKTSGRTRDREPAAPGVKSDAYVGMLALALVVQVVGAVFLWLDYSAYTPAKPPPVQERPTQAPTTRPGDQPGDKGGVDKGKA
jgi:hypothetical protein